MTSGIYQITNWVNNKIYIGSAVNLKRRWTCHKSDLNLNKHSSITLQRAWVLHGQKQFTFTVLEICEKEKLIELEQHWLDKTQCYNPDIGYNINPIAGSRLGAKHTEEWKAIKSQSMKGRKLPDEQKIKIGLSHKGSHRTNETKEKMSAWQKGKSKKKHTEEAKIKIGIGAKNTRAKERLKRNSEINVNANEVLIITSNGRFNNNGGWTK